MSEIDTYVAARVNSLLLESAGRGYDVTPLRLQKLVYLSYGMYLKTHDSFLEHLEFEAWNYGPVIRAVYGYYKHLGSNVITKKIGIAGGGYPRLEDDETIKLTVDEYGGLDAFELVALTHNREGAWYKAFSKEGTDNKIEHSDIQKEFRAHER